MKDYYEWLLCCFYTIDTTNVTLHLSQLSDLLIKYAQGDSLSKLFKDDHNLMFSRQVAPIKKGKSWIPRYLTSIAMETYTIASI